VNDLKPVGTANNGTVGWNTVSDGGFTFDGTGDYITIPTSGYRKSDLYCIRWVI
jgi:hypothetical protein